MKRIWNATERWLERIGIHLLAIAAFGLLIYTTIESHSPQPVPQPGSMHADPEPWLYDLSLGLLAAYAFNFLVVELPAKRKRESRLRTLQTPLTTIAFNGLDMIRELERIAKCPPRRITEKHLKLVLAQLDYNLDIRLHLMRRMRETRAAYDAIVPYAADLPLDLQERLQDENQHLAHRTFNQRDEGHPTWISLDKMRNFRRGALSLDHNVLIKVIMSYYQTTEAVRMKVEEYVPSTRAYREGERTTERGKSPALRPGRRSTTFGLENDRYYPYRTYPEPRVAESEPIGNKSKEPEGDEASKEPVNK